MPPPNPLAETSMLLKVALIQGVFYLLTGLWPIVDIESFQLVTGPKTDLWLVKTVGVLVTIIGAVLVSASKSRRLTGEITLLAVGTALGLAAIDLIYALSGHISAVYLVDAAAEIGLAVLWGIGRLRA
jgi:hypothetical protein